MSYFQIFTLTSTKVILKAKTHFWRGAASAAQIKEGERIRFL